MSPIFLDASGVIFNNGTAAFLDRIVLGRGVRRDMIAAVFTGPSSWALRLGKIEAETYWRMVGPEVTDLTGLSVATIRSLWIDSFAPNPGMLPLLEDLKANGHELGLIAETTRERAEALERRFPIRSHLRWAFLSFETGEDKREGELFRHAIRAIASTDGPPIMVEDEPAARDAAERAGFEAVLFRGANELRRQLIP